MPEQAFGAQGMCYASNENNYNALSIQNAFYQAVWLFE